MSNLPALPAAGLLILALLAGCASPRLQTPGQAPQSPHLAGDHAVMADGTRLPLTVWLPEGRPRAVVLALHGFNDYRAAFAETGRYLADLGYAVYAYDQRGFGETEQRGLWPGAEVLADDAWALAGLLRVLHADVPLHGFGESMGGTVLLRALARHGTDWLDGVVLVAPAVWGRDRMPWYQRGGLWLLAHTLPWLELTGRGLGLRPTDNKEALRRMREDPLVIKATRVDALWGMAGLMDGALSDAAALALPSLILYGGQDEIIPRTPTCRWLAALPRNGAWRLAVYPDGWHMLTRDLQADRVHADLAAWLADPAAPLPSGTDAGTDLGRLCADTAGSTPQARNSQ
ncbi:MAG TPA: lysophospholipase [Thiobacillaceae bacterium]|nr:lysophospholipase [Thiobacillaceae bacterium]